LHGRIKHRLLEFITGVFIDDLGHTVFAAGYFGTDFLVRAYDARTGNQLWEGTAAMLA
jgi:hypothetical protein